MKPWKPSGRVVRVASASWLVLRLTLGSLNFSYSCLSCIWIQDSKELCRVDAIPQRATRCPLAIIPQEPLKGRRWLYLVKAVLTPIGWTGQELNKAYTLLSWLPTQIKDPLAHFSKHSSVLSLVKQCRSASCCQDNALWGAWEWRTRRMMPTLLSTTPMDRFKPHLQKVWTTPRTLVITKLQCHWQAVGTGHGDQLQSPMEDTRSVTEAAHGVMRRGRCLFVSNPSV